MKGIMQKLAISFAVGLVVLTSGNFGLGGTRSQWGRFTMPEVTQRLLQLRQYGVTEEACKPWPDLSAIKPTTVEVYVQDQSVEPEVAQSITVWNIAINRINQPSGYGLSRLTDQPTLAITSNPESADVIVTSNPRLADQGQIIAGQTSWHYRTADSLFASVELRTTDVRNHPLAPAAIRSCALHEFGHVLGLSDNRRGQAMAGLNLRRPVLSPSADEAYAVAQLRSVAKESISCSAE